MGECWPHVQEAAAHAQQPLPREKVAQSAGICFLKGSILVLNAGN